MAQAHRQTQAEASFKTAREQYESVETRAYKQYQQDKEYGVTNDNFYNWMPVNYPQASAALNTLQSAGAQLSQIWSQTGESQERIRMLGIATSPNVVMPGLQTIRRYDEEKHPGQYPTGLRETEKKKMDEVLNL